MYTIKEVADKMDVSEHTLRFWANNDFFPFITRDKNNVRIFADSDLYWVYIVKCLRSTGADNKSIKRYIDLCIEGDSTIQERYEIIKEAKLKAEQNMKDLIRQIEMLERKEEYYENLINNKEPDKCNPIQLRTDFDTFFQGHLKDEKTLV